MKLKKRILPFLFLFFFFIISAALFIFSILIFVKGVLWEFQATSLFVFLLYFVMSSLFLIISISSIKWYTFNGDLSITISYLGILKTTWRKNDIKGYIVCPLVNKLGFYNGVIIENTNGRQIFINEFEFKQFEIALDYIEEFYSFEQNIKEKIVKI